MIIPINFNQTQSNNYEVYIQKLENLTFDSKVVIFTNPTISGLHLQTLLQKITAPSLHVVTIPDGEKYKNMSTIETMLENLFNQKCDRKTTLIAFGGGVIGDMVGFCASLYQRGVDFVQIPTTLLAGVDSSVGGKTGVNNRFGKNLIGAFYQPKAVYCDVSFFETLPRREFGAGVAEAIKMAITFDREFFEFFAKSDLSSPKDVEFVVQKCVQIKAAVVSQDEKEKGIRAVLNYGHTFGHVIENFTNYEKFLHGEAVAIGLRMANELSLKLGQITKDELTCINEVLKKHNLYFEYKVEDAHKFYEAFFMDKKSLDSVISFILPSSIGGYKKVKNVDKKLVIEVLEGFDR